MKVKVVSDLHLECCEQGQGVPDLGTGELLILGGDILCARHFKRNGSLREVYAKFLSSCSNGFDQVLYLAGNHEPYGYNYEGMWNVLRENLHYKNIHILENDCIEIGGILFIGCTLWTDFRGGNALEMMKAAQCMNDYKTVRITPNYRRLSPEDTYRFHQESIRYISSVLDRPAWVLTHHAPSYQSVHPRYLRSDTSNGAYVSDLDDFILSHPQIRFWSHGHTHDSFDYEIGGCRVICNPRGYYGDNGLNPDFDPDFTVVV